MKCDQGGHKGYQACVSVHRYNTLRYKFIEGIGMYDNCFSKRGSIILYAHNVHSRQTVKIGCYFP